ncbi:endonuclease/exonuclease/phosphatase family protein [Quadrisphaera sp. DSM 44207]|uniref:endonuclease/exonuclease/phosphatase family protein n=1 Tax=Quadrisphaera sp. DSM 44207 TaxID=1881057 RepID=UPI000882EC7F|nr:Metal-dependent hydrolase, endonuclease/exonuclease/phosphatase family [Quadrisphaera sp. DSM 44207]
MSPLRVAALNLASGRGADGALLAAGALARGLAALAALEADVVALQEVDVAQPRSGGLHQAALAAQALGAADWRFAPALVGTPDLRRTWRGAGGRLLGPGDVPDEPVFGVALLSRRPVRSWHALPLRAGPWRLPVRAPDPRTDRLRWRALPDEPRVALAAVLDGAAPDVAAGAVVASTHLSFGPPTAARQLRQVRRWLLSLPAGAGPRVLAGDLNLPGPVPAWVTGGTALVPGTTFPGADPRLQLDHVLLLGGDGRSVGRGAGAPSGTVVGLPLGDHRAVVADVLRTW